MIRIPILCLALLAASAAGGQQKCDTCSMPGVSGAPSPAGADAAAQELRKLDAELDRAILAGDKEAVAAILADDMMSLDDGETVLDKEHRLKRVGKSPPSMNFTIETRDVAVKIFGDAAVVTSRKKQTWELNGRPDARTFRETNTYVRREGRWRLVVSQRSDEAPPYAARDVAFDLPSDPAHTLGNPDATIVLYEYSDYQCPFCRRFAAETLARVKKEYIDSGRVALVFRNYPLEMHPRAFPAAIAAECAVPEGKFWAMNERILREPAALSSEDFARDAREIGLDSDRFDRCVEDASIADGIRRGIREAAALGIAGTPQFVIGVRTAGDSTVRAVRMIEGAYPYEIFQATLEGVLRTRGAAPAEGR